MDKPVSDTFLSKEEICSLTDRGLRSAQAKVLNAMKIEHRVRPDGSIVILRAHILKIFDGEPASLKKVRKIAEPNWDSI